MAYNPVTGKLEEENKPLFTPERYSEQSRILFPMQPQVAPSPAATDATRAVMQDPQAFERVVEAQRVQDRAVASNELAIENEMARQGDLQLKQMWRAEIEPLIAENQRKIGVRSLIGVPSFDEWLAAKKGDNIDIFDRIGQAAGFISEIPAVAATTIADVPSALEEGRTPQGYRGRNLETLGQRRTQEYIQNTDQAVRDAELQATVKTLEAQTPENQAILQAGSAPMLDQTTEPVKAEFKIDVGLNSDPATWAPAIMDVANQTISLSKDLAKGAKDIAKGEDTPEARTARDFGYESGRSMVASGAVGAGIMKGGAMVAKLAQNAAKARAIAQSAKDAAGGLKEAQRVGDAVRIADLQAQMKRLKEEAEVLFQAVKQESRVGKAALTAGDIVAEEAAQTIGETALAGAQGQASTGTDYLENLAQELTLQAPGLTIHLPKIQAFLKSNPGVTRQEFEGNVLPKLAPEVGHFLQAAKHKNVRDIVTAVRDVELPRDSQVRIDPNEKILGEGESYAGYDPTMAGAEILGESDRGKINIYGGATAGTVSEESIHAWQQEGKAAAEVLARRGEENTPQDIKELATAYEEHIAGAKAAEDKIKRLPKDSKAYQMLSEAFGRDLKESPLTGDEIAARITMVENGWKAAEPAEDLLAKIARSEKGSVEKIAGYLGERFKRGELSKADKKLSADNQEIYRNEEALDEEANVPSQGFATPATESGSLRGLENLPPAPAPQTSARTTNMEPPAAQENFRPERPLGQNEEGLTAEEDPDRMWGKMGRATPATESGSLRDNRAPAIPNPGKPNQDVTVFENGPRASLKKRATPEKDARGKILSGVQAMLARYGKRVSAFDLESGIDSLKSDQRLKFHSELDRWMSEDENLFREVGMFGEGKADNREELIYALKAWANNRKAGAELKDPANWDTKTQMLQYPDAPSELQPMEKAQAQDLVGRTWMVGGSPVEFRKTKTGVAAYESTKKDGKITWSKITQLKAGDDVYTDKIQTETRDYPDIPDEVYNDYQDEMDLDFGEPVEVMGDTEVTVDERDWEELSIIDKYVQDFRTKEVGRQGAPKKEAKKGKGLAIVPTTEQELKAVQATLPKAEGGVFKPAPQLTAAQLADLQRGMTSEYPGKETKAGYSLWKYLKNMGIALDTYTAQYLSAVERAERANPGIVKAVGSAYQQGRLMPGAVFARIEKEIRPVQEAMFTELGKANIKMDEAEMYAYALAAIERNNYKLKTKKVKDASGFGTEEAILTLNKLADTPAKKAAFAKVFGTINAKGEVTGRGIFQKINDAKLDAYVEAGLMTKETADFLKETYSVYVAMKSAKTVAPSTVQNMRSYAKLHFGRALAKSGLLSKKGAELIESAKVELDRNQGLDAVDEFAQDFDMSVKSHGERIATGRATPADYPLSWAMRDAINAISKAERSKVQQMFAGFVKATGADPRYISISDSFTRDYDIEEHKVVWKNSKGEIVPEPVVEKTNEMVISLDGKVVKLTANPDNFDAVYAIKAMKQSDLAKLPAALKMLAAFNNFRSSVLTRLNPLFPLTNTPKDVQNAFVQSYIRKGSKISRGFTKALPKAMKDSFSGQYGKGSKMYQDYIDHGGAIAFMQDVDVEEIHNKYTKTLDRIAKGGKFDQKSLLGIFEFTNNVTDKAVRLAAYAALIKSMPSGMTEAEIEAYKKEAALFSRDATVDFNAKGFWTPYISAFFLFANPGIQQFRTVAKNLTDKEYMKRAALVYGAATALGYGVSLMNRMQGDDEETGNNRWDDVPEYKKSSSIMLLLPDSERDGNMVTKALSVSIPLMYGSAGFFFSLGELIEMAINSGKESKAESLFALAKGAVSSAMPVQEVLPSGVVPFWELGVNENFAGMPIVPENPFAQYTVPDAYKAYRGTPAIFKKISETLNAATVGTDDEGKPLNPKFHSGAIDISPETLNYMMGYFGGALYNESKRLAQGIGEVSRLASGDTEGEGGIEPKNIPGVSKFLYAAPKDRAIRAVYDVEERELKPLRAEFNDIKNMEGGEKAEEFLYSNYSKIFFLRAWDKISAKAGDARKRREKEFLNQYDPEVEEKMMEYRKIMAKNWNQFKDKAPAIDSAISRVAQSDLSPSKKNKALDTLTNRISSEIYKGIE